MKQTIFSSQKRLFYSILIQVFEFSISFMFYSFSLSYRESNKRPRNVYFCPSLIPNLLHSLIHMKHDVPKASHFNALLWIELEWRRLRVCVMIKRMCEDLTVTKWVVVAKAFPKHITNNSFLWFFKIRVIWFYCNTKITRK